MHAPALEEKRNRIRVAAYCRVSTDHEDQETSFEAQQTHFTNLISGNPGWELVGIYADEESGTRAQTRENFMRMIADCEAGKIDMVLSKSISRWARNTLDSLKYIRKLKALEIPIFFTKESINTMDAGGEVLVTILASIAQQESASISQNVQIGVRYHYQEGKVCSGVHRLLGYNRTPEGSLVIVPEEAEIVQRIFRDYLDGYSPKHIARMLAEEGVDGNKTTSGGTVFERNWNDQGITYILKNEKYSGDLLLQKYYTVDFLTKKVAPNNGQLPQYFVENSHEPVIPREIFQQVQAEMARRRKHWQEFKYYHSNVLSSKVVCGNCGLPYRQSSTSLLKQRGNLGRIANKPGVSLPYVGVVLMLSEWVDFHWEVDGKMYDFSMPGGGFVSFRNLIEVLGIVNGTDKGKIEDYADAENVGTSEEYIDQFLADVNKLEFSDPELVSVSKVEENTTVGAIKDALGLVCEYSAELTEEEIGQINTTEVTAADWALISLKAFDTEENLTVTMKDGEVFTIRVTDQKNGKWYAPGTTVTITRDTVFYADWISGQL